ncbi:MAG TPA: DUF1573 domain-containing protein [Ferruginibacter sp.]|jgi:hypothetical protein|nr:DUF1573 domain-containing protein [Ferruginibacter sp.]
MKKIVSFFVIISSLVLSVKGQTNSNPSIQKTDILTLKEKTFDFGKIPQGRPVKHIFEVVNNGTDSLKISSVQASCGCTTPEWEKDKIVAPGKTTIITVGYNAATAGIFSKTITITYNNKQTKFITISGEVWKTPATSAPENKQLGDLEKL